MSNRNKALYAVFPAKIQRDAGFRANDGMTMSNVPGSAPSERDSACSHR